MIFHPISAKRAETSASVRRRGDGPLVDFLVEVERDNGSDFGRNNA